jgi:hypothetical protein
LPPSRFDCALTPAGANPRRYDNVEEDSYATTEEHAAFLDRHQLVDVSGVGNNCLTRAVGQSLGLFGAGDVGAPATIRDQLVEELQARLADNHSEVSGPLALPSWPPAAPASLAVALAWLAA